MKRKWFVSIAMMLGAVLATSPASARHLSVDLRTDRGNDAVYQPGEDIEVRVKTNDDAYLLVYEIDAEGYIHVLFPTREHNGLVEGGRSLRLPNDVSDLALVVQGPVGQGYIVAVAAEQPFNQLPWYLRPYDPQASELGYFGAPEEVDDDQGVTAEGRIVGDPFVAMERIRGQIVGDAADPDAFATTYTSYYVHQEVKYPRYLCYDCHRPGYWSWWADFDPYYTSCSVFDFRVNWRWAWGPSYWFGHAPYYVYVYRRDCPPHYRHAYRKGLWYSSWHGWRRWHSLWGGSLIRYKTDPPVGYVPPAKYKRDLGLPPGYSSRGKVIGSLAPTGTIGQQRGKLGDDSRGVVRGRSFDGPVFKTPEPMTKGKGDGTDLRRPTTKTGDPVFRPKPIDGVQPKSIERPKIRNVDPPKADKATRPSGGDQGSRIKDVKVQPAPRQISKPQPAPAPKATKSSGKTKTKKKD